MQTFLRYHPGKIWLLLLLCAFFTGMSIGATTLDVPAGNFDFGVTAYYDFALNPHSVSSPLLSTTLGTKHFLVGLIYEINLGMGFAYFDLMPGIALKVYPFGEILNLHIEYLISSGTVLLNNYGHFLRAGIDLDVPVYRKDESSFNFYLGADVAARHYWRLLAWLGPEQFFNHHYGIAFSIGMRWRFYDPASL